MNPTVEQFDFELAGKSMHRLATELYPMHRSITGQGVRQTFEVLSKLVPLEVTEVPTGTSVFDWTVPQEWSIRDAYIADSDGCRIVDYAESNLHVVNYSQPVRAKLQWDELKPHIHNVDEAPDTIPYRTTYFRDGWGFCVTGSQRERLSQGGPWQVVIDSEHFDGSLSLAECCLPGTSNETVVFHCHTCHPSLANDNLSGIVVATELIKHLRSQTPRLTYRFVFAPATIGAITWLAHQSRSLLQEIKHGLVLTLLGDSASFTYKRTRLHDAVIDRIVPQVLADLELPFETLDFSPAGYDERQFGSPGIALPVGRLTRSLHGEFPEYHTSADDLTFVQPNSLAQSLRVCMALVAGLEANVFPINRNPMGEPQLGKYGVFRAFGEQDDRGRLQEAMMWILTLGDGLHDVLSIAQKSRLPMSVVIRAIQTLISHDLIVTSDTSDHERFCQYRDGLAFVGQNAMVDHTQG